MGLAPRCSSRSVWVGFARRPPLRVVGRTSVAAAPPELGCAVTRTIVMTWLPGTSSCGRLSRRPQGKEFHRASHEDNLAESCDDGSQAASVSSHLKVHQDRVRVCARAKPGKASSPEDQKALTGPVSAGAGCGCRLHTLRVIAAGRMACSVWQLVASIDGSHKRKDARRRPTRHRTAGRCRRCRRGTESGRGRPERRGPQWLHRDEPGNGLAVPGGSRSRPAATSSGSRTRPRGPPRAAGAGEYRGCCCRPPRAGF